MNNVTHLRHARSLVAALALPCVALSACGVESETSEPTSEADEALVGGTPTNLRPEIGTLSVGCTATLVDPRFVITAAHCFNYISGPMAGSFDIVNKSGNAKSYPVDKSFSLAASDAGVSWRDVAFARLATPVAAADATPTGIWPARPPSGTAETIFGFGCQQRGTASANIKQFYSFTSGTTSSALCKGDSGGPVVWGGPADGGFVFAVNSGYTFLGADVFGDAAILGPPGLAAIQRLSGTYVTNAPSADFAGWASVSGVKAVVGDFNGDFLSDIALAGGSGWTTQPVAFSKGDGTFTVTDAVRSDFAGWAQSEARLLAGDFNGDGRSDLALVGGLAWNTVPIAFSNGNGTFTTTNAPLSTFPSWAQVPGAKPLVGDFNGDGRADIALVGGQGWSTIPIAFSNGDGTFYIVNNPSVTFASWAGSPGAQAVVGDFNWDGRADIALSGTEGWSTVPLALSDGFGGFVIANPSVPFFPGWASSGAKLLAGDFDGDGRADLALTGGPGWVTIGFAFSTAGNNFIPGSFPLSDIPDWSRHARSALVGKFSYSSQSHLALTGGSGWNTIPVTFFKL